MSLVLPLTSYIVSLEVAMDSACRVSQRGTRSVPALDGRMVSGADARRNTGHSQQERGARMEQGPSLTELVARAGRGDQRAWDGIVARFTSLLWSVARSYRLDSGAAADAVQSTWLRLVESLNSLHDPEALPGWLLTTARREAIRILRAKGRDVVIGDVDSFDSEPSGAVAIDTALLLDERDAALWASFGLLGERCQRLLRVLMAPECPPYAEVAGQLGMPVGSIGPTRGRCLSQLRRLLAESDYDFGAHLEGKPHDR
ncbi:MAG: RNA polymerase sigma factor [Dermatophilaceae bacterium]